MANPLPRCQRCNEPTAQLTYSGFSKKSLCPDCLDAESTAASMYWEQITAKHNAAKNQQQ